MYSQFDLDDVDPQEDDSGINTPSVGRPEDDSGINTLSYSWTEVNYDPDPLPSSTQLELAALIGEPLSDMKQWHQQSTDYTCAVVAQEFILDSITGQDFTEAQLMQEATANGWLSEEGTPLADVGKLLESHGIRVERQQGANISDLTQRLAEGEKVIVAVDSAEIWNSGAGADAGDLLEDVMGYPGTDSDHAVQVIGIDNSDPSNPIVILNDPGTPEGQGSRVPLEEFTGAWQDSGSFMMSTDLHDAAAVAGADNLLRGSDYIDRDPETGVTVRRW